MEFKTKASVLPLLLVADSPDVAIVDVEGQTDDAEQDAEAGKDGHSSKQLLRQEPVLLDHHRPISRRPST